MKEPMPDFFFFWESSRISLSGLMAFSLILNRILILHMTMRYAALALILLPYSDSDHTIIMLLSYSFSGP
jgi:hypothetical protein